MSKAHSDSNTKLSYRDVQIYARNLIATTIEEHLNTGKFSDDLASFSKEDRQRITRQLHYIASQMNGVCGSGLPPQKPGRPKKKGQESA